MRTPIDIPHRLLVSGPNGGGLALVSRGQLAVLGLGNATGLAVSEGAVAWCAQDDGANRLQVLRDGLLRTVTVSDSALDLHDLLPDPGGDGYWAVATEANAVLHLGQAGERARHAFADAPDSWHLNSLAWHQGRLLASHFGRFDAHRGYKGRTRGAGEVIEVATGRVVLSGLAQPHSLVSVLDELWLCNSETSELWVTRDGERLRSAVLPGYTRGLVVADDAVYVGLSRSRNESQAAEGSRFDTAAIAVLDRADLSVRGFLPLPWPEIYDLRVLADDALAESLLVLSLDRAERRRPLALPAPVPATEIVTPLMNALREEGETIRRQAGAILDAVSDDIRRMQAVSSEAQAQVQELSAKAALGRELAPRLEALQQSVEALAAERAGRAELEARHLALVAANARLEAAHQSLLDAKARNDAERLALEAGHAALAEQHAALESGQAALKQRNSALEATQASLEAQLAEDANARHTLRTERDAALAEVDAAHRALCAARHEVEALNDVAAQLAAVRASLSWRLTKPLRVAARILRGQWGAGESDKIRRLLRGAVARAPLLGEETRHRLLEKTLPRSACPVADLPTQADSPLLTLATESDGLPDIFVWSVIDWHFRFQRPQHLARALAQKGHRVFYPAQEAAVRRQQEPVRDRRRRQAVHARPAQHLPRRRRRAAARDRPGRMSRAWR